MSDFMFFYKMEEAQESPKNQIDFFERERFKSE